MEPNAAPQTGTQSAATQLLITLSGPDSEVVGVEALDKSGKKWEVPVDHFCHPGRRP